MNKNIKFTVETESSNSLYFMDVRISRLNNKFITSVYRKPTFSGQGISFFSFAPFLFKLNAIKTLIFRSYTICSSYHAMHSEFDFLRNFFISNGFPSNLISSVIRNFLNKRQDPQNFTVSNNDNPVRYYVFPYFGPQSDKLKK